jgi:hypothetical protein
LPHCYTVLSKDCSSDPKFVVMMRKLSPNTDLKQIKIVTKTHKIVLIPSERSQHIRVIVNDQERLLNKDQDLELNVQGYPIIRIVKENQHQVKVECLIQGLKLRFDGYVCDIKVPQVSYNKQCGLCGLSSMEMTSKVRNNQFLGMSDLTSNQMFSTHDVRNLFIKYVTNDCRYSKIQSDEECTGYNCQQKRTSSLFWPEHEDETCDKMNSPYTQSTRYSKFQPDEECTGYNCQNNRFSSLFRPEFQDETRDEINYPYNHQQQSSRLFSDNMFERSPRRLNDEVFGEHSDEFLTDKFEHTRGQRRPMLKHKVVEREDEVCVSLVRIPQCPVNTYPERKIEKRMPYKCVSRNDPRVWQYESRIRHGEQIPEIQRMTPSLMRTEIIPLKCSSFY